MKKTATKLTLSTETLRKISTLDRQELAKVGGASGPLCLGSALGCTTIGNSICAETTN